MKATHHGQDTKHRVITQNVRGLGATHTKALQWMQGWKNKLEKITTSFIMLQETHVSTHQQADRLTKAAPQLSGALEQEEPEELASWFIRTGSTQRRHGDKTHGQTAESP